jgi:hypothetical protein
MSFFSALGRVNSSSAPRGPFASAYSQVSAVQFVCCLCNLPALVACSLALVRSQQARAIITGDCRRAVGEPPAISSSVICPPMRWRRDLGHRTELLCRLTPAAPFEPNEGNDCAQSYD